MEAYCWLTRFIKKATIDDSRDILIIRLYALAHIFCIGFYTYVFNNAIIPWELFTELEYRTYI